jgi:hypothetical protein
MDSRKIQSEVKCYGTVASICRRNHLCVGTALGIGLSANRVIAMGDCIERAESLNWRGRFDECTILIPPIEWSPEAIVSRRAE